jgi:hypothetical protein
MEFIGTLPRLWLSIDIGMIFLDKFGAPSKPVIGVP